MWSINWKLIDIKVSTSLFKSCYFLYLITINTWTITTISSIVVLKLLFCSVRQWWHILKNAHIVFHVSRFTNCLLQNTFSPKMIKLELHTRSRAVCLCYNATTCTNCFLWFLIPLKRALFARWTIRCISSHPTK